MACQFFCVDLKRILFYLYFAMENKKPKVKLLDKYLNQIFGNAKAKPKQDPYYGKSRRLAKKLGATIEVERCAPYSNNYWVHFPESVYSLTGFPFESCKFAEYWGDVYTILEKAHSFIGE
tara:strand:- start:97 stop:456 length:360 start_codon:yes stop_codon:yes gene_type:complete